MTFHKPLQLLVETWVQQLKLLLPSIQTFDAKIREIFVAHPDANIMVSFPGAGSHLAPRMLAALGEDRRRYSGSQDLQCYFGVAPVKEKSGKKEWIHWRLSCPKFLRQTFIEWANRHPTSMRKSLPHCRWLNRSRNFSFWASEFYDRQRQAGKTHQVAIRSLAFKWIRILFRCWQERQPYDEAKYLMALKKKGSPLVKNLNVEKT